MIRIDAEVMIPGRGDPVTDGSVVMDGNLIRYAGPTAGAPSEGVTDTVRVPAVMPGMWECHGHFMGERSADLAALATVDPVLIGLRVAADAAAALDAGFTSVREVGGAGVHLRRAVDEGTNVGPHVYGAGAILSPTGGHADLHMYPVGWVHDLAERTGLLHNCDGVPECLRAVRLQLRKGARLIKICASGGVMSEVDHPIHQQFSAEELRVIVEEAARAERVVAAHCHGKPGIVAALEAGVRTIEHGTYLDEETAAMMRELDAVLVPTRLVVTELMNHGRRVGLPDYAFRKLEQVAEHHADAVALAIERGVTIALGTDVSTTGAHLPCHWGQNGEELALLAKAGMSALQAVEAATANGPLTLGPQAPRAGVLTEGYDADVIAVASNPLEDLAILGDPDSITWVWKAGEVVKRPGGSGPAARP
ncbi:MAG TPA: amidohydrolase family protein [Acidimicrobiales bacterium]|nr:amidohydrolase family protein [Acidimicrobiales bacterium]